MVYIPEEGEEKEGCLHTLHVRADLIDSGAPTTTFHVESAPKPKRKVATKTDPQDVEMRVVGKVSGDTKELATSRAGELLTDWSTEGALNLVSTLAEHGFSSRKSLAYIDMVEQLGGSTVWWSTKKLPKCWCD